MRTVAFIPARLESRRFPRKNLALFRGRSLVGVAVDCAVEAQRLGLVDRVVVSHDAWQISEAVRDEPVERVRRPESLCSPSTRVIDVLRGWLGDVPEADRPELVCVLLPTSPLRTLRHLVASYRMIGPDVDVVLSVTPFRQDVRGALAFESGGPQIGLMDSYDWTVDRVYKHDGTVAWLRSGSVLEGRGFYDGHVVGYLVPPEDSADVDTPLDLEWAEFLAGRKGSA